MAIKIAGVDVINDDRELVLAKLTDINETINDTAVDVFIYDTSKDSDGGAWRHRTQHTSWYAEASSASRDVNTRSTRAEFPAVAVIVAESNKVTIYDGDDPSLPMWMVFNQGTGSGVGKYLPETDVYPISSVTAKEAVICVAQSGLYGGFATIRLLPDNAIRYRALGSSNTTQGVSLGPISERDVSGYNDSQTQGSIVNETVNDVAMTVLPDAPTDPATGLPVPTIAVATDGGLSVIKDDGTVQNLTGGAVRAIAINDNEEFIVNFTAIDTTVIEPLNTTDTTIGFNTGLRAYSYNPATGFFPHLSFRQDHVVTEPDGLAFFGTSTGGTKLHRIAEDYSDARRSMLCNTTSSYTTGWMPGDIKMAALADTTAETLSGSELVADFSTYADQAAFDVDWNRGTGWTFSGGVASIDGTQASTSDLEQSLSGLVAGKTYIVEFEITALSAGRITYIVLGGTVDNTDLTSVGTYSVTMVAGSANNTFIIGARADMVGSIDNISVRLADPDRSVNGNGLGVHGSITKAPVATGADLMAYSGFSASNYLEQPYNADLDFGTGDFCVMGWSKTTRAIHPMFSKNNGTAYSIIFGGYSSTSFWFGTKDGSGTSSIISTSAHASGAWMHYCGVRKSGVMYLYENGVLIGTSTATARNVTQANDILAIGYDASGSGGIAGDTLYSLLRISATAPTADQIKKIYEDEKVLFQPNAKATLTGSSDAVTALAHDPDTGLLHVGTSGGRSVFQGLRRVDETATAVTTAISAVDGLVVEQ